MRSCWWRLRRHRMTRVATMPYRVHCENCPKIHDLSKLRGTS